MAKLTFGVGKHFWEYKSSRGRKQPIRKTKKAAIFLFFVTFLYFVGAPFEFSGRAPFKPVTPLIKSVIMS